MASGSRAPKPVLIETYTATAATVAHVIVIWHATAADNVIVPAAAPDLQIVGVTMHAAVAGGDIDVCVLGPCILKVDGNASAIAAGDAIEVHSTAGLGGKLALSDGTTLKEIVGVAYEAASADNAEISVFVGKNPFLFTA